MPKTAPTTAAAASAIRVSFVIYFVALLPASIIRPSLQESGESADERTSPTQRTLSLRGSSSKRISNSIVFLTAWGRPYIPGNELPQKACATIVTAKKFVSLTEKRNEAGGAGERQAIAAALRFPSDAACL